jgi:signal transduction histidine kinase
MKRPWLTWIVFACCLAVVIGGLAYVTRLVLGLDKAQSEAVQHAALQEKVRLALWRMDSAVSPLVAQENARPYFHYSSFYPAERAYGQMLAAPAPGEVLIPSPLLTGRIQHVLVHFQADPRGRLSSPEVPEGEMKRLAARSGVDEATFDQFSQKLQVLRQFLNPERLAASFPGTAPDQPVPIRAETAPIMKQSIPAVAVPQRQVEEQKGFSDKEYAARAKQQVLLNRDMAAQNAMPTANIPQEEGTSEKRAPATASTTQSPRPTPAKPAMVGAGSLEPAWFGDMLVLGRRVWVEKAVYVQGCWLDWPGLSTQLLGSITDLLPEARLEPIQPGATADPGLALASLPVRLVPGRLPQAAVGNPLLRLSLLFVWGCVVLASLAAGLLLHQALSLSQRRGAFVSAVTHELRTPLTTFRLYTEMLVEGMAPDEKTRNEFLQTLQRESERLDHLVKNVLAYARLEGNRSRASLEEIPVSDLLARAGARLGSRAAEAGMKFQAQMDEQLARSTVRTDASAVEQILFNLVDNAAKYAAAGPDPRIELRVSSERGDLRLSVRDYGPGISKKQRRRLFRPFSKSAFDAAGKAPGVGLGLALCRNLARSLGGRLIFDPSVTPGACFVLRLPKLDSRNSSPEPRPKR